MLITYIQLSSKVLKYKAFEIDKNVVDTSSE